ncbi:MAG: hypothetical protein M1379_12265 [Firmicutes bacterium]|nr:hypothetical protein [Bacillota bacterium]
MDPQIGRFAFRIAFFPTFVAAVMLPFLDRRTPEFSVAVFTVVAGLIFVGVIILLVRRSNRV